jgi:hypothetical protein
VPVWLILLALAILAVAGALFFKARQIKARHLRFVRAEQPEQNPDGERLVDATAERLVDATAERLVDATAERLVDATAERLVEGTRALYHGTRFLDGTALLIPAWRDACVCDLWCTAEALFVQREAQGALLSIPLAQIDEAALHRAFAALAGKELPMLRLRWHRGGEQLETAVSLRGGMASLESLRREIHLRQGNIAAQLRPFLEKLQ